MGATAFLNEWRSLSEAVRFVLSGRTACWSSCVDAVLIGMGKIPPTSYPALQTNESVLTSKLPTEKYPFPPARQCCGVCLWWHEHAVCWWRTTIAVSEASRGGRVFVSRRCLRSDLCDRSAAACPDAQRRTFSAVAPRAVSPSCPGESGGSKMQRGQRSELVMANAPQASGRGGGRGCVGVLELLFRQCQSGAGTKRALTPKSHSAIC